MEPKSIDAVATVRQIRDAQYEQIKGRSPEEQIRYFREKSANLMRKLEKALQREAEKRPAEKQHPTNEAMS